MHVNLNRTRHAGGEEEEHGSGDEELEEAPVEKLFEPFGKDQLVVLVKDAVSKYPDLRNGRGEYRNKTLKQDLRQ
ncbi:hypothetical protein U1Q18_003511, partial [Sarracenia purpurea var. burkii]